MLTEDPMCASWAECSEKIQVAADLSVLLIFQLYERSLASWSLQQVKPFAWTSTPFPALCLSNSIHFSGLTFIHLFIHSFSPYSESLPRAGLCQGFGIQK